MLVVMQVVCKVDILSFHLFSVGQLQCVRGSVPVCVTSNALTSDHN